jgi:hypothetical protein
MRISLHGRALVAAAWMIAAALGARGQENQTRQAPSPSLYEVGVNYSIMQSNREGGATFWTQGGSVQAHRNLWRGLGVAADASGLDTPNENIHVHDPQASATPVGLDLITFAAGPRYTWGPASSRYALFGQFLAGWTHGMNSVFAAPGGAVSSASSVAWVAGGGLNMHVSQHISLRAIEADWLRTALPNAGNGVQNNLRLGAGLIWRIR